jgi:ABC-type branched-subunit amino acid transport system substrate-binding protein
VRGALVLALSIVACSVPPPAIGTPTPSPEAGIVEVTALLDLSGPGAPIGTAQRSAMELWRDRSQASVARPEVRLTFVDVAGSEARLLIELRRAAEEQHADAVVIGVTVAYTSVLGRAIELASMPILFTLPLDVIDPVSQPGGRWAFALAPPLPRIAAALINDAIDRGVLAPALVLRRDGNARDLLADAVEAEMIRRGRDPLTEIPLPAGGAVPAVVRSSLSVLRSAQCTAAITACGAVAREARAILAPTLFYLPYMTAPSEIQAEGDLASRAIWPASRWIIPAESGSAEQERFLADHAERSGPAGSHAAVAYDAVTLLALAAAEGGADDPELSRAALERITMPLIGSSYTFNAQQHSGSHPADLAFVQWRAGAITYALPAIFGTGIPTPTPSPTASPTPSPVP